MVTQEEALALLNQEKHAEAAAAYKQLIAAHGDHTIFWNNLGFSLGSLRQFEAALACSTRAVQLSPQDVVCLINHASNLYELNYVTGAINTLEKALKLQPDHFSIHRNLATVLGGAHDFDRAWKHLKRAEELKPGDGYIAWLRASFHLKCGNLKDGWKDFESRSKLKAYDLFIRRDTAAPLPLWDGRTFKGKTLLIHEEQGMGDTIFSARYIAEAKARGGTVILACKPPLHRLLQTVPGVDEIIDTGASVKTRFDYQVPIMTLPSLFGATLQNIPAPPMLFAAPSLPPTLKGPLDATKNRFKVGIVWSGNPNYPARHKRSTPFSHFLKLAAVEGVDLFSLQKGAEEADLADHGARGLIAGLGPHVKDFADTAAVLKRLDLVIMTDSAVAHLAGSLGVPVWNLLSYDAYWLYLLERDDCPWYPSMRLFRQPTPGDWESVFARVTAELTKLARMKKAA